MSNLKTGRLYAGYQALKRFIPQPIRQAMFDALIGRPKPLYLSFRERRIALSNQYLRGEGIEIGALQDPLPVPAAARVQYVDRMTKAELLRHYPELPAGMLVEPSIIDDGHLLRTVADGRFDFCIANHVLEHMRDPLGALRHWLRVLRPGGTMYVAVPDRSNPHDRKRAVSTFEHLVLDGSGDDRAAADREHFVEWAYSANGCWFPWTARRRAQELEAMDYSIHFHVFDAALFRRLIDEACRAGNAMVVEQVANDVEEMREHIAIVRMNG